MPPPGVSGLGRQLAAGVSGQRTMTVIIIFITLAVSVVVLQTDRDGLIARLGLRPYDVVQKRQWWRVVTHGFVHADYVHLAVNMITFFSFGRAIEQIFQSLEAAGAIGNHTTAFLLLYFGGMVAPRSTT